MASSSSRSSDKSGKDSDAHDERTPLLNNSTTTAKAAIANTAGTGATEHVSGQNSTDATAGPVLSAHADEDAPMPKTQVILLCFAATVDPVSYFAIFPIIGDMLVKVAGLPVDRIALWSGLIETMFSIVQMLVMIGYGKLADRIGRKPVLVFSLFGIAGSQVLFGLSQNLWHMIALRCLAGFFAGSTVCIRAMLGELTNKKTQATAFSWFMFARNVGILIGPLIGGTLANPHENIPALRGIAFLQQFPYSLSLLACAVYTAIAAVLVLVTVGETLKTKIGSSGPAAPSMTTSELLRSPGVMAVLLISTHVSIIALAFTAVFTVFQYTPVDLGGFGLPPNIISIFVAIVGGAQAAWMLGPFPPLQRRFGTGAVLRGCAYMWPFFMAGFPILNELRRAGADTAFYILNSIFIAAGTAVSMAFTCMQLALNDVAPSSNTLGALNALALTVQSATRSFAPVLGTGLYEWGVRTRWIHGHLFWIVMIVLTLALCVSAQFLPEAASDDKPVEETHEESPETSRDS